MSVRAIGAGLRLQICSRCTRLHFGSETTTTTTTTKNPWVNRGKIQADSCDPKTGANIHREDRAWNLPWEEVVGGWEWGGLGVTCHGLIPPAEGGGHSTKGRVQAVQAVVLVHFHEKKGIKHQQTLEIWTQSLLNLQTDRRVLCEKGFK